MYRDNRHLLVCSHFSTKVEDASLTSSKQETGTVSTTIPAPEDLKTAYICTSSFTFTFQSLNIQNAWTSMHSWLLFCHISTSSFVKRINVAEATYTHSSVVPKQTLHTMQAPKQFCSFQNMGKTDKHPLPFTSQGTPRQHAKDEISLVKVLLQTTI